MSKRANRHVRHFLSRRLKAMRNQRDLSQRQLGHQAGLSAKFIGEVERGEKSISVDSLYRVAVALDVPLRHLTDVPTPKATAPDEAEKIFALVAGRRRNGELQKAYQVLRAMFRGALETNGAAPERRGRVRPRNARTAVGG